MYDLINKTMNDSMHDLMEDVIKDSINDWMNDDSLNDSWLDLINYLMSNSLHDTIPFGYGLRNIFNESLEFISLNLEPRGSQMKLFTIINLLTCCNQNLT